MKKLAKIPLISTAIWRPQIANNCILADAWATALMTMGEVKGVKFAKQNNLNALFIIRDEQGLAEIGIGSFAD